MGAAQTTGRDKGMNVLSMRMLPETACIMKALRNEE